MLKIYNAAEVDIKALLLQRQEEAPDVSGVVRDVIADVRHRGDDALYEYTLKFDRVKLDSLRVSEEEIESAKENVGEEYLNVLRRATDNITAFHEKQVSHGYVMAKDAGIVMGRRVLPLESVGVYVPGGTAAYPSTVLMDVIPAKIAGVQQIVMLTPPGKDGCVNPAILAAAHVAGVHEIYKVGGAQAIAALAYGTQSVPGVDKIVGPGNIYVATAKQLVFGVVDIDMIAGPSDILVLADDSANARVVAADMLSQAEHDVNSAAVLVTTSEKLAADVCMQIEKQLENLPRAEIAKTSLKNNGCVVLCGDIYNALEVANAFAPEHLELCTDNAFDLLPLVKNAGSVFLGHNTPEALGDYFAGPNHTLPTAGTARFSSGLSVDDFIKKSSFLYYSKQALVEAADAVQRFARSEGLDAHARSVEFRLCD